MDKLSRSLATHKVKLSRRTEKMVIKSFVAFSLVLFTGGAIFMSLEREKAEKSLSLKREIALAKARLLLRCNISKKEVEEIYRKVEKAMQQSGVKEPYKWDYYESCFFVGSLLTTIGKLLM